MKLLLPTLISTIVWVLIVMITLCAHHYKLQEQAAEISQIKNVLKIRE